MPDFLQSERCCDLVMKGGLTSGILYPPAICRIAEEFHLVGIGGTSAGAIAACAAAAAEYRRRHGSAKGFKRLERLPHDLAGEGRLSGLFRPDASTRSLHSFLLEGLDLEQRGWIGRRVWKARLYAALLRRNARLRPLVENGFGLCSGMANGNRPNPDEIAPLTEWLADEIDAIAGKDPDEPLTFGDLWRAPLPQVLRNRGGMRRSIDLRAVTTSLSFGRPYELPFKENVFAFDPEEWQLLFPKRVLHYLMAEAERIASSSLARDGKLPLPSGDRLPVIVAARMSLSFPGLFSMVPLYAVNFNAQDGQEDRKPMEKVWFSDGGITSNLPIHRFDSLFPSWPTLGINLQYTDGDGRPARSSVGTNLIHLIQRREDGAGDLWHVFDGTGAPEKDAIGFAGAIFRSAQVWHDHAFLRLPSFRDRVIEIWLRPDEGGLNLAMPAETIKLLIERGNTAGVTLRDRFTKTPPSEGLSWNAHRWARLRSGLAGLAAFLHDFKRSVDHPLPGDPTLDDLLVSVQAAPAYRFESQAQFNAAKHAIDALRSFVAAMDELAGDRAEPDRPFSGGPRPPVEIGTRAPI